MKLNSHFIVHDTGEEQIMAAAGGAAFSGLVRSNKTAGFIIEQLKKETTVEQIVEAVYQKYDAPKDVIEEGILRVLDTLRSIGALDE